MANITNNDQLTRNEGNDQKNHLQRQHVFVDSMAKRILRNKAYTVVDSKPTTTTGNVCIKYSDKDDDRKTGSFTFETENICKECSRRILVNKSNHGMNLSV